MARIFSATYQPYTYDELAAPLREATAAHQAQEQTFDALMTDADKMKAFLNEDWQSYKDYKEYVDNLNLAAEDLARNGLTRQNAHNLLGLKRQYSGKIQAINAGILSRQNAIENFNKSAKGQSSRYIGPRPEDYSVDEYMYGNNPFKLGVDGSEIYNYTNEQTKALTARLFQQYTKGGYKISEMGSDPDVTKAVMGALANGMTMAQYGQIDSYVAEQMANNPLQFQYMDALARGIGEIADNARETFGYGNFGELNNNGDETWIPTPNQAKFDSEILGGINSGIQYSRKSETDPYAMADYKYRLDERSANNQLGRNMRMAVFNNNLDLSKNIPGIIGVDADGTPIVNQELADLQIAERLAKLNGNGNNGNRGGNGSGNGRSGSTASGKQYNITSVTTKETNKNIVKQDEIIGIQSNGEGYESSIPMMRIRQNNGTQYSKPSSYYIGNKIDLYNYIFGNIDTDSEGNAIMNEYVENGQLHVDNLLKSASNEEVNRFLDKYQNAIDKISPIIEYHYSEIGRSRTNTSRNSQHGYRIGDNDIKVDNKVLQMLYDIASSNNEQLINNNVKQEALLYLQSLNQRNNRYDQVVSSGYENMILSPRQYKKAAEEYGVEMSNNPVYEFDVDRGVVMNDVNNYYTFNDIMNSKDTSSKYVTDFANKNYKIASWKQGPNGQLTNDIMSSIITELDNTIDIYGDNTVIPAYKYLGNGEFEQSIKLKPGKRAEGNQKATGARSLTAGSSSVYASVNSLTHRNQDGSIQPLLGFVSESGTIVYLPTYMINDQFDAELKALIDASETTKMINDGYRWNNVTMNQDIERDVLSRLEALIQKYF